MPLTYQKNLRADWDIPWVMFIEWRNHWQALVDAIHPHSSSCFMTLRILFQETHVVVDCSALDKAGLVFLC